VAWNNFHLVIRARYRVMKVEEWGIVYVVTLCTLNVTFNDIRPDFYCKYVKWVT
jgi:hypothetical protein